jgi:gelsolin
MIKAKEYNIADSNIANLGTELEKNVKLAAAMCEPAWDNAGAEEGLKIWRIEKFHVIAWPDDKYGFFYDGDSYIVLKTQKNADGSFKHDIHFWLGKYTTQDEAGTAAYKTVELDDRLGGGPVQHREVQGYESQTFCGYFEKGIVIWNGGIDSGFNHVEPEKYRTRLLRLKGKKNVRAQEMPVSCESLNEGDVFILDAGLNLYQWQGSKASGMEKVKAAQLARAIDDERKGLAEIYVMESGSTGERVDEFFELLGGKGPIKAADEVVDDAIYEKAVAEDKKLFCLSDESGTMKFELIATGEIKKASLCSDDAFIFDTGAEVFAWVGKGASPDEKRLALGYAQSYLSDYDRPPYLPITRILEGGENEVFNASFDG